MRSDFDRRRDPPKFDATACAPVVRRRAGSDGGAGLARDRDVSTGLLGEQWQRAGVEENLIFAGLAGLEDPPRLEVALGARQVPRSRHRGNHGHRRPSIYRARRSGARSGSSVPTDPYDNHRGAAARAVTDVQLRSGAGHDRKSSSLASCCRSEKPDRRCAQTQGTRCGSHRRRGQRRAGAEECAHRNRDGTDRHRRGQGGGRRGAAGRQLRQHRQRGRGGARGLQQHPQVLDHHSRRQRARADSLPGFLAARRPARAHPDSNPFDRHGRPTR